MDSVCIGLTSFDRVTFAEDSTGWSGLPTDVRHQSSCRITGVRVKALTKAFVIGSGLTRV